MDSSLNNSVGVTHQEYVPPSTNGLYTPSKNDGGFPQDLTHQLSSQFNTGGGRLLEITRPADTFDAKQMWFQAKLRGSCWTSVRIGDFIYGSAGGHNVSFLAAFNWRTGEIAWRRRGFHMAQSLFADGKLIFLNQDGKLTMARVSPDDLEVLGSHSITESVSWTLPTLVDGKLYVRDRKHILALDLVLK